MRLCDLVLTVSILWSQLQCQAAVRRLVAEFQHGAGSAHGNLSHLLCDTSRGTLYVAGTNVLYQLDDALRVRHKVETGPVLDSHQCNPSGDCDGPDKVETNNYPKVLVIDRENDELLMCGSVRQGSCYKHSLNDISRQTRKILKAVAANTQSASTFGFIGPAKYNPWVKVPDDVLYVGTTYTKHGDYRYDVPAISSRSLYKRDDLNYAAWGVSEQSLLKIDVKYRDHFLVNYVHGFNTSSHVYFATVQKKSYLPGEAEAGYVTRISRICINDPNFNTYSEVTLQCHLGGENYNLLQAAVTVPASKKVAGDLGVEVGEQVLMGVFSPAVEMSSEPQGRSAICIYSLQYIDTLFDQNIHMCFNGSMEHRNLPYISGAFDEGRCPSAGSSGNIFNFCEAALKISGPVPIVQEIGADLGQGTLATSVTGTNVGDNTVAIVGTSSGTIMKILIADGQATIVDSFKAADNEPILSGTRMHSNNVDLIVLTPRRVKRMKIADCSQLGFCGECLNKRDPFCGWCSLQNECTLQDDCTDLSASIRASASKWLSLGAKHQCIHLENITPSSLAIGELTNISLQISKLPDLPPTDQYQCVYDGHLSLSAVKVPGGLVCPPPPIQSRPNIVAGSDHVTMNLAVTSHQASKEFVSTNIMLFSCDTHSTCLDCVSSLWPCSWCIYSNKCSHMSSSSQSNCREAIVSADTSVFQLLKDNPSQLISYGAQYCPRVELRSEIFVPNNVPQELSLPVTNLPDLGQYRGGTNFMCEVEIEENIAAKFRVPARLESSSVVCDKTTYKYESGVSQYNASISVIWDRNNVVDRTNITLYKCPLVGSYQGNPDCSLCLTRAADLGCVWCGTGCEFTKNCPVGQSNVCPQPIIHRVKPLSGPVDGGTIITIEGSNLAMGMNQLKGKVMVGDYPCKVTNYQVSVKIECKTSRAFQVSDEPVRLQGDNGIIESVIKFRYRDVRIDNVTPRYGPVSGGTVIAVEGVNLNIGSNILVFLDNLPCKVNLSQVSSSRITCVTSPAPSPMDVKDVIVIIDDARRTLSKPYRYTPDPSIDDVQPKWSFISGGRMLTVHGRNLDTVGQPYIAALDDRGAGVGRSPCRVVSPTQMECPSPAIVSAAKLAGPVTDGHLRLKDAGPPAKETVVRVGFEMDNVVSVLNLAKFAPDVNSELIYVEDPVYYNFEHNEKSYKGDALVIEGFNLNGAAREEEVEVRIGDGRCNVTSLTQTQLLCIPPQTAPSNPEVVVNVGNLNFTIGMLRYDNGSQFAIPPEVIGGIGAAAALTLFIAIAFMIIYKHKSSQAEREYKRIQIQMDTLENNVRSECKQAFAELQTDMTDLTMDLEVSGIPLLDHRTFVMKVFFPGVGDHPLFLDPRIHGVNKPKTELDGAMIQFEGLLNNKWFLLSFIETMERQKSFTIRDRVYFASLLSVVLMTKMEYFTDILRTLLLKLVEKSMSTKHPQLMLRRTESIVEKMLTNWLALAMYDYMKDYAGSSLFVLFKAIKFQIEKGPVDQCTHDARYSLSEDRLLREPVSAGMVRCCVVQDELEEDVVVRVLDCDSISQVKLKILDAVYKNTPFSLRPAVDEVDLEWRCGQYQGGHIILQDLDITSKIETSGWRKLNTLAHYGVKDKVVVSLVAKQVDSPSHHIYQAVSVVGRGEPVYAASPAPVQYDSRTLQMTGSGFSPHVSGSLPPSSPQLSNTYSQTLQHVQHTPVPVYSQSLAQAHEMSLGAHNVYHLVRPDYLHTLPSTTTATSRTHKAIPEIFLTRLLSTKGTVQKFVDDFFGTILKVPQNFPPPVKWLFDILDDAGRQHCVHNPEVLHAWKSNCLPLRFWVNFIKNPDFIFDVNKTVTTDSCLSVIAQTFMDSCSLNENILGKDSPSSKLLFAKDIPLYRQLVMSFYQNIQNMPQVSDQELNVYMQQLSAAHGQEFDNSSALKELYIYVNKYFTDIMDSLDESPNARKLGLGHKLKSLAMSVYPQQNIC